MKEYKLPFGTCYLYDNGILEIIVDEGIKITTTEVQSLINLMSRLKPSPRLLLANRKNNYSFSFSAMQTISQSQLVEAVAELHSDTKGQFRSKVVWPEFFRFAFFVDRDKAISWLLKKELTKN